MSHWHARLAALALAIAAGACTTGEKTATQKAASSQAPAAQAAQGPAAAATAVGPRDVTITAADFVFAAPDTIPAGATRIHLVDRGPSLHHVQLVRLDGGHTVAELVKALSHPGPPPTWAQFVGGPNTPAPGATSVGTVDLQPGNYAIICVIPAADGVPHFMKGMHRPLTVVASTDQTANPTADITMKLVDYAFDLSAPLTAGHHTIRVVNEGTQLHEAVLVRLAPGKNAGDLVNWVFKQVGPPPGTPLGGSTMLDVGASDFFTVDLAPGEYALFCFVPDAKDGKPHVMHGMIKQFSVS